MEPCRLGVPSVDDIPESGCRNASPDRRRHVDHPLMNDCSIARISSLRASILPATAVIRSKSVFSDPAAGVVIWRPFLCCSDSTSCVFDGATNVFGSLQSEKRVRRPNGFLADVVDCVLPARCALTTDADPHGVVDENRPVDLASLAEFSIRGDGSLGATIVGIEPAEYTGLLIRRVRLAARPTSPAATLPCAPATG